MQVNTSAEPSKYGLEPDAVEAFVQQLPAFDRLRVRGLMTLAIFTPDVERVRACFVRLRELRDQLQRTAPPDLDLSQLSMGMSGDSKWPSRKVPPWSASARPFSAPAPPRTASTGRTAEPRHEARGCPAARWLEDLGTLQPLLLAQGWQLQLLQAGVDALDDAETADLLVVLGGPISANDTGTYPFVNDSIALLQRRLQRQRPTLGICLGAQLMARALGASVAPSGGKESACATAADR